MYCSHIHWLSWSRRGERKKAIWNTMKYVFWLSEKGGRFSTYWQLYFQWNVDGSSYVHDTQGGYPSLLYSTCVRVSLTFRQAKDTKYWLAIMVKWIFASKGTLNSNTFFPQLPEYLFVCGKFYPICLSAFLTRLHLLLLITIFFFLLLFQSPSIILLPRAQ